MPELMPRVIGRVVSVNVGRPREVQWKDTTVRTAFFKYPVPGRIPLIGSNLQGDGQADLEVHGGTDKAVFVYSHSHYAPWAEWLGYEPEIGMFGENLTVEGFAEEDVAVGDILHIGTATLVVTEPRQPCYKVDVRLGVEGGAAHMVRSGMVGFYLGLVEAGSIAAGDEVTLVSGPTVDRVTPGMLHALGTSTASANIAMLEKVASITHLPEEWQDSFRAKATALRRRDARKKAPWVGFREFTVDRVKQESTDARSIFLKPSDGGRLPKIQAGQFVTISFAGNTRLGCPDLQRSYTLSSTQSTSELRITVRHSVDSRGGSYLAHQLVAGDRLGVSAPGGDFVVVDHPDAAPALLISAGIGITTILSMATELSERSTALTVIHCARDADDAALLPELEDLAARHFPATFFVCVSGDPGAAPAAHHLPARLDDELVARVLAQPEDVHLYLCGPDEFISMVRELAARRGVAHDRIHFERFVSPSSARRTAHVPPGGFEVTFSANSSTMLWSDPEATLLDLAEDAGADIAASCRQGVCGTCSTRLLQGDVSYVQDPQRPVEAGWCLPCIAVPAGRITLEA